MPIQNAPHMVLKLESNDYLFSASYWNKGLSDKINIWDDEIYELYKQKSISGGSLISIKRETIQTKGGAMRCLKIMHNLHQRKQGINIYMKMLSYIMLQDGYLFSFIFTSQGKYTKGINTVYPDNIMKGIRFKSPNTKLSDFDNYTIEVVKKLNAQCPMKVDECTTHLQVILSGKTVMIKTQVENACDSFIDYDEFKQKMCKNFSFALDKSFVQYLDRNEYSIVYMIYNEYDQLKKKIAISGRDILNFY